MTNLNVAIIEGRLVKDPEIRYTQEGTALCRFSLANNFSYTSQNEIQNKVNFIEITTFSRLAEICSEYLKKGNRVIVNGKLRQKKWQDRDGINHSRVCINGEQVHFLDYKVNNECKEK